MQRFYTPSPSQSVHAAGRTPRSFQAFLLGCSQAFAWLLLMIAEQLLERWAGVLHYESDFGLTGGWYGLFIGSLVFVLVLGLTLQGRRHYMKLRPLAFMLLGFVIATIVLVVCVLGFSTLMVIPAAG